MTPLLLAVPFAVSLAAPLTADEAARLALARNPAFKALLEEVGLAQADLDQAGLPANPRVHGALRYAGTQDGARGHELGVKVDLLSLFELPLKKRVASTRLEQARFRLSHEVLGLETQVKAAYYDYQAAARRLELRRDAVAGLEAAADLARRGREAGNLSRLDLAAADAVHQEGRVELAVAQAAAAVARERLARLAGLQSEPDWSVPAEPPALPA
ncbi:MAG: TolC family protein, partial [Elusimicrobiota bacterium]|nr:TolC family protein [Elusimicrobiota bacterium]